MYEQNKVFKKKLSKAQKDYTIRVAEGYTPHKRSPKRITILVSEAYLASGGSIHWVKNLEAVVFKLCKEYSLDCDELELESVDRSYRCRKTGKFYKLTQFDNHLINTRNFSREDIPLAMAIVHYLTYNYYQKEDLRNGSRYYPGRGVVRISGNKQSGPSPLEKRKGATTCQPHKKRKNLSGSRIHGVGKTKLHKYQMRERA